jgi:hypothetical protein
MRPVHDSYFLHIGVMNNEHSMAKPVFFLSQLRTPLAAVGRSPSALKVILICGPLPASVLHFENKMQTRCGEFFGNGDL